MRVDSLSFSLQAVAILKRTKGKVSLVVARKQGLPGSPPSPRRETGSPRVHKKGPPVAKKPVKESTSDMKKPGSPRKAESPKIAKKPFESVPTGSVLNATVPTGSAPTGSPLVSRREPVQSQAFEPVVQIVQQSPRETARKSFKQRAVFKVDCSFRGFLVFTIVIVCLFLCSCFADTNPASKSPHHTNHSRPRMCDRDSQRQHRPGAEYSRRCRHVVGKSHL